ncbi:MAG: hypothetical protein ACRELD_05760 [Longimicrobiales bacterium]
MHTEHLQNVRPSLVGTGWLIAVAVGSFAFLALVALGLVSGDWADDAKFAALAVAVGFGVGGFVAGFRAMHAPILHGVAIGLTTLVAWVALNLITVAVLEHASWSALSPTASGALLLEQIVAAVLGAWIGYTLALRGQPEPAD